MTLEIRGEQRPISRIFNDEFVFSVPPYQRPYLWETEHAGALLDDLLEYMGDANSSVVNVDPYFLGSIVLIKGDAPDSEIVDGQQRLITLTILLSALRSMVGSDYATGITKRIHDDEDRVVGHSARFRLRPKPQDAEFFEQHIQRENGINALSRVNVADLSDSKRHMAENARHFIERLATITEAQRNNLVQFIIQKCILVVVSTPDLNSAYRIFKVLNDRGLDLSYADILKAEIIGTIPLADQQVYTEKWEGAEEDLGRDDFESLLSHIRMLFRRQKLAETTLEEFRKYVITLCSDSKHLIDDVILPYSEAYATIKDENYRHDKGGAAVNSYLRWLNRIPDADWLPAAMLYLAQHRNEPAQLERFFKALERLAAVMMLRRTNVNKRIERYAAVLAGIDQHIDLSAADSPIQLTDEERHEVVRILDGDLFLQSARLRQYVLLRLDAALADGAAIYRFPIITVEHVLPQRPARNSQWLKWYLTPELRDLWVHRLANLVLLSRRKNAQAGNYDFDDKKKTYFRSRDGVPSFALTAQVLSLPDWKPERLAARQDQLLDRLRTVWNL